MRCCGVGVQAGSGECLERGLQACPDCDKERGRDSRSGVLLNKVVTVCKQSRVVTSGVMKPELRSGLSCMPLIEVFGGYLRELFAIGNDITLRIDEFIKFPVGASSVKQFACFTEMFPIESCLFACPVEPREFSLKFSPMSTMEKFAQVFDFTSKLRRKL